MEYFVVNERCSTIRGLAREALSGKWVMATIATLIFFAITFDIPAVFARAGVTFGLVGVMVIYGPMVFGIWAYFLKLSRNQEVGFADVFSGFQRFGKAVGLMCFMTLLIILWSLLAVPALMIFNHTGSPLVIIPMFLSLIPATIAGIRYSQAFFLIIDNPDMGVIESINKSKIIMAGNKMKYFLLLLSFTGWFILAAIPMMVMEISNPGWSLTLSPIAYGIYLVVTGIGLAIVGSYVDTSLAIFYDMVVGNLRAGIVETTAEIVSPEQNQQFGHMPNEQNQQFGHEQQNINQSFGHEQNQNFGHEQNQNFGHQQYNANQTFTNEPQYNPNPTFTNESDNINQNFESENIEEPK